MPLADEPPRPPWQQLLDRAQQWADRIAGQRTPPTSVDGVAWNLLPFPGRWHRCRAQSWGSVGPFRLIERCPCGGTRLDGEGPWLYRNRSALEGFRKGPPAVENVDDPQPPIMIEMREALKGSRDNGY